MSVQYLIDYENVHEAGLCGIKALAAEDSVYIFHTSCSDRITLSCLDDVQAWVRVILVPPGKQSLDMHLGSFLGYLIGKEDNPDTQYAIVSKDGDYKGISDFWNRSYQLYDKVACTTSIWSNMNSENVASSLPDTDCTTAERIKIQDFIIRSFSKYGVIGLNGLPCMLVSDLCTRLNALPEYNEARKRLVKKPMQFLREVYPDLLQITKQWSQDWVYLLGTQNASDPVRCIPEAGADSEKPALEASEPDIMEIADLSIDRDQFNSEECTDESLHADIGKIATETVPETDTVTAGEATEAPTSDPGDSCKKKVLTAETELSIDDVYLEDMKLSARSTNSLRRAGYIKSGEFIHLSDQELLKTRNLGQKGVDEIRGWVDNQSEAKPQPVFDEGREEVDGNQDDALPAEEESDHSVFVAAAMAMFKSTDKSIGRDENEHLRASEIRDMLLAYPEFRRALKQSGMKPIAFLKQLLEGKIDIYRSKGIFWACMADDAKCDPLTQEEPASNSQNNPVTQKKQSFYEQAFNNIQKQLSSAGLDKEVADEIANIFMRSNSAVEPRKVIHTLLCQRFGTKLGAKYYRQTVKYAGA